MKTNLLGLAAVALMGLVGSCSDCSGQSGARMEQRIQPGDLVYQGAFRLPDGENERSWEWGGMALAHHAAGNPDGAADGFPGSLFGTGNEQHGWVSEISIPVPVISKGKRLEELHTARTLQSFGDVRSKIFKDVELPRMGLACLPRQGQQTAGKLYFCWSQHMQEGDVSPTHAWCDLDLNKPSPAGPWAIGHEWNYVTAHYMMDIPAGWAEANTPGMLLGTGRFREGGQGSLGPALFAIGPWNEGNPPPAHARLKAVCLLKYSQITDENRHMMKDYHHADDWTGAAWLTRGEKSAVVFVGTKGLGKCWYGFANGVVWPDEPPYPPIPPPPNDDRGWWSTGFEGRMIFYDPADLAAVAKAKLKPHELQPYATLRIDEHLFNIKGPQQKRHTAGVTFDRARGLLYVAEFRADGDKPLIHVWKLAPPGNPAHRATPPTP